MEEILYQDIEYEEYFLFKDNIIYKIVISKIEGMINIKCKNYFTNLCLNDLLIDDIELDSIDDAYEYLINIFEENNVTINNIEINKQMKLLFRFKEEKGIEIKLFFNKTNNDFIVNEINRLKDDINILKDENNKLKKEIEILKRYHDNLNPKDILLLSEMTKDSYSGTNLDNTYNIFKSINNKYYLVYANENKSIICYDLNEQTIIKELKNYHNEYITNIRYYFDEKNKRDLIMSVSKQDNNIRIWNAKNWECILNIPQANEDGYLLSSCFLCENSQIYIITSNCNSDEISEQIKVFDFNGNAIKEMKDSNEETYFIDNYYDKILSINYIIAGNNNYVKSYDFNKNELYRKYYEKESGGHGSIIINNNEDIIKLIDSGGDGNIRIWNFHSGLLLSKIQVSKKSLYGICLWNNNYLFVGCADKNIKLIELHNELVIKSLAGHNDVVLTIKKINHPQYGECLISQGSGDDQIKLWVYKK